MGENKKEKKEKKEGSGNAFKIIIVVLLLVIIIGVGTFAVYYFISTKNNTANTAGKNIVYNTNTANAQNAQGTSSTYNVSAITANMDEFLVNLADPDGKKYLQVTIYIGYENKKMTKEITDKKAIIRDSINSVLRSKQSKDFTAKGTEDLKTEILNRINPIFTKGKADSVYFYNILVQ